MITNNLLSEEVIIRGEWVLSMSDEGAIRDGAVHISDGIVKHVNKYSKLKEKLPGIKTIGDVLYNNPALIGIELGRIYSNPNLYIL